MKHDKKEDWTFSIDVSMGFMFPRRTVLNKVKKFCLEQNIDLTILESGFLMKDYTLVCKGHSTAKHKMSCYAALKEYFIQISNI